MIDKREVERVVEDLMIDLIPLQEKSWMPIENEQALYNALVKVITNIMNEDSLRYLVKDPMEASLKSQEFCSSPDDAFNPPGCSSPKNALK